MTTFKLANLVWIPLIGGSLLIGQQSFAQDTTTPLTLEKAIDFALENNGSIKIIDLEIQKLETLKKSSFSVDKTDFGVQYGQMNSFNNDFAFSVAQHFKFPTVYTKQKSLNQAYVNSGEKQKIITENDLIKEIKLTWFQMMYLKEQAKLLAYQDSLYTQFFRASQLKYETGDATYLEQVTAETKLINIRVMAVENESNQKIYLKILQTLINKSDVAITILDNTPIKKEFTLNYDSTAIANNPNLVYLQNQINVAEQKTAVNKAQVLPEISVGYFNQSMIGNHTINGVTQDYGANQRFQGIEATLSIPLFVRANKANINGAKIDQQIASSKVDYYQTYLSGEFERVVQDYIKYKAMLDYYENSALQQADLILDNANKSYLNGNISYLEYVQSISTGTEIKTNYNTLVLTYNQSIIAIEYLLGER